MRPADTMLRKRELEEALHALGAVGITPVLFKGAAAGAHRLPRSGMPADGRSGPLAATHAEMAACPGCS